MWDHEPTRDELDDAVIEDTVHCARCYAAFTVTETFCCDDRSVCCECAQDEFDELIAARDRLLTEVGALLAELDAHRATTRPG